MTAGTADPGPGSGRRAARPASFLPGPVPDRETLEGWTRWRLTRRDFVPAPVITAAEHAAMTARQRRLHDLHRVATHSNLAIQETPMSAFVSRKMRSLIETNAFCQGPDTRPGLMVNGGACQVSAYDLVCRSAYDLACRCCGAWRADYDTVFSVLVPVARVWFLIRQLGPSMVTTSQ